MAASKNRRARLFHARDAIEAVAIAVEGLSSEQYEASYINRRAIERPCKLFRRLQGRCRGTNQLNIPAPPWTPIAGIGNVLRHEYQRLEATLGNRDNTSAGSGARRSTDDCRARRLNFCPG
jgi:uncharacterized protein with HEPN domain